MTELYENSILNTLKTISNTIGIQLLTIKIHEHDGHFEEANKLKELNQTLENQLTTMVALYRKSFPVNTN
jgi:hypothetical protein